MLLRGKEEHAVDNRKERDADELFLNTLRLLSDHTQGKPTRFELLMVAAALRKLLLDGQNSLLIQVNRRRDLKLRFKVNQKTAPGGAVLWWVLDGIDPEIFDKPGAPPFDANLDQLLSRPLGRLRGVTITVKDAVRYFSNVAGGVHFGVPRNEKERTLAELDGRLSRGETARGTAVPGSDPAISIEVDELSGPLRSLRAVGRIVLRSLQALAGQVRADL